MNINILNINKLIKKKIKNFYNKSKINYYGKVISIFDGICYIHGLYNAMQGELLKFSKNIYGLVLNLEENFISAIILGNYKYISEGDKVKSTNNILKIPVSKNLCGRIINALGNPIDGKGKINFKKKYPIDNDSPGVIYRKSISKPLYTGIKSIDTMIPIGKGQRELIIGDRQTGKTSLAIDTIINQKDKNIFCIYVAIGQKISSIKNIVNILKKNNAMKYTIIVSASASEPASMQYISPYSGCAIGEYFRDKGYDSLIIYDDLSKHAMAYRQISLLLRRPPGREAYPGDIFYLHSRLLERASYVNIKYIKKINKKKNKCGSLTALPIIETQLGDVSSFIPTNVISITDGQIFLETSLFNSGIRPAINPSISVSRVGSSAQNKIIKKLSSGIRTNLAQYKELESFSQFTSELDIKTKKLLNRGIRIIEIFKQDKYSPISFDLLSITLYFLNKNYLDDIKIKKILIFEKYIHKYIFYNYNDILKKIKKKKKFNKKIKILLNKIIIEFKNSNFYKKYF